jgi:hypothetical protein
MRKFLKVSGAALLVASCLGLGSSAHAAYAQLTPPLGWNYGGSAAATYSATKSAAQVATEALARINANAALSTGGRTVPIPVKLPLAEGAAKAAASAIFLHPGLRTVATVATWVGAAGLAYDVASGLWQKAESQYPVSTGYEFKNRAGQWVTDWDAACKSFRSDYFAWVGHEPGLCGFPGGDFLAQSLERRSTQQCPSGWYVTPAGCVQTPPMRTVSQPEFEQMVPDARPMPPELPGVVWPAVWPVKAPEIQPMFIPTGNPVPNPNYDPSKAPSPTNQPYNQPGVRVVPAPTADNPWQVDVQPVDRPVDSPIAKPEPTPEVLPDGTPAPNPNDKPREPDPEKVLTCGLPDTPACKIEEKGTPEPVEDTAQKDAERVHKPLDDFLKDPESMLPSFPTINWTFRLPSGCAPISIPAFAPFLQTIDVCQFQPIFHDIMSMIWVGGALFGAIGTFWRNVFAKAG